MADAGNLELTERAQAQQDAARQQKLAEMNAQVVPHGAAITTLQGTLASQKPGSDEYNQTVDKIQEHIHAMREIMHPDKKLGATDWLKTHTTDRMHITNHDERLRQQQEALEEGNVHDRAAAAAYADAAPRSPLTPEEQHAAARVASGLDPKQAPVKAEGDEKWTAKGKPTQVDGKWVQPEANTKGEYRMQPLPEGYAPPVSDKPKSMYAQQRETFAKSLGKTVDQLDWKDEQNFLKERYSANQPYAQKRLQVAEAKLHLDAEGLELRRSENNMNDFLKIQKDLLPSEKISTTADRVDDYVTHPTGPGDAALTFAFIEATKPSSGFRFTESERQWISGARGLVDGAQAKFNQGYEGTTFGDEQRKIMSQIIKRAATQASAQKEQILGATGAINPTATHAARAAGGDTSDQLPPQAASKLKEGHVTTFSNGQQWTKKNGLAVRVK